MPDGIELDWVEQRIERDREREQKARKLFEALREAVTIDVQRADNNSHVLGASFSSHRLEDGDSFEVVRQSDERRVRVFKLSGAVMSVADESGRGVREARVALDVDGVWSLYADESEVDPQEFSQMVLEPLFFPEDKS